MDLDELRDALDEIGSRTPVDPTAARAEVGARSHRLQRRRRSGAIVSIAAAIALVVGTIALTNTHGHKSVDIRPAGPGSYADLPSRYGAALAYDSAREQTVLFGGVDESRTYGDTWLWDGTGWTETFPALSPPARQGAVMAYDPIAKQTVLFGGTRARTGKTTLEFDDTWTWNGTTWTARHPAHVPPWNDGLAMSYDPRSRSVLLLTLPSSHPNLAVTADSVSTQGETPFGTWRWDGSDWTELPTPRAPLFATPRVAFHDNPRLAPLPSDAGLLFYSWAVYTGSCPPGTKGGPCKDVPDPTGTRNSQTWTWDGRAWTEQHPSQAPIDGQLVATPGSSAEPTVFENDGRPWHWTGSDWVEDAESNPAPRDGGAAVYDASHAEVVAYAGRLGTTGAFFDTWTWNGTWTLRAPGDDAATTTVPSIAATTTVPPTSTTNKLTDTDPLPVDSVMLAITDDTISLMDTRGNIPGGLIAAFDGHTIVNAQFLSDHSTIWYASRPADGRSSCPEIVKVDLYTKKQTVVAHADDFAITPDGRKLVLVFPRSDAAVANNCQPVPLPSGVSTYSAAFVVRDLTTRAQWTLPVDGYHGAGTGGPHGHVYFDTAKNKLITANCVWDGCLTSTYSVPERPSDPIVYSGSGPTCRCETLAAGDNGVYGVSGVDDSATQSPRTAVVRYPADGIDGPGAVIATSNGVELSSSVAPTASGVFVIGGGNLYRADNGSLTLVGPAGAQQIFAIPPFVAG